MPFEISEILIRVRIAGESGESGALSDGRGAEADGCGAQSASGQDRDSELLARLTDACVANVLRAIRSSQER